MPCLATCKIWDWERLDVEEVREVNHWNLEHRTAAACIVVPSKQSALDNRGANASRRWEDDVNKGG